MNNRHSFRRAPGVSLLSLATLFTAVVVTPAFAAPAAEAGSVVTVTDHRLAIATEVAYVEALHTQLGKAARYPTGREASLLRPTGTASVWVDVDRHGHVVDRGLQRSSDSMLLDRMAIGLVGRARYAAFPSDAWTDGATHRFRVAYRFSKDSDPIDGHAGVDIEGQ